MNNLTVGAIIFAALSMLAIAAGIIFVPIMVIIAVSNLIPAVTIPIDIFTWGSTYFLLLLFVYLIKLSRVI